MATTVTYKSSEIANFTNTTKTLKTSGKYMEGDVVITETIANGSATTPATTITTNPTITLTSSTGVVKAEYTGSSNVTPTVVSGWVAAGTAGKITTTGTKTYQLPSKGAATYTPSTSAQTIASNQWLTGVQTIAAMGTGTVNDPTATKGTVSNNAVTVTPAVSWTTGYVAAGSKTGSAVTVSASELVGGTLNITAAGSQHNVTNYKYASVAGGTTGTPVATKGTVASNQVTVTPTVTNATGYITGGTITGTAVTVSASELVGGTATLTGAASNHNVVNYSYASVKAGTATTPATTITTNPTVTIASATGVVTATYTGTSNVTPTVASGWVAAGTSGTITVTGTKTLQLTSKGATTYNTSTADQTIASNQWLTGAQTIKSVTTANLTAANIVNGVTVKVGDANNASRITQVTGTYAGIIPSSTVTLTGANSQHNVYTYQYASVRAGAVNTPATTITATPGMTFDAATGKVTATNAKTQDVTPNVGTSGWISAGTAGTITVNGSNTYTLTPKSAADLTVAAQSVTVASGYYSSALTKAVTTTTHPNPTATIVSSTGVVTATHAQTVGYVAAGTTTGTLNLTTKAATTYNTSTADQTVASYRWLTGNQTIKSVTTENITAANIKSGVTVKVGDANNSGRIKNVTGTLKEAPTYTCTIGSNGDSSRCYVQHSGTKYYTGGASFTFHAGDTILLYANSTSLNEVYIGEGLYKKAENSAASYSYTAIGCNIGISIDYDSRDGTYAGIRLNFVEDDIDTPKEELALYYPFPAITPGTEGILYNPPSSYYGIGNLLIKGDSNLIPANIASGVSIFGVTGTHAGGITPTGTVTLTGASSQHNVYNYQYASIKAGSATVPATTIPQTGGGYGITSSTARVYMSFQGGAGVTPTITSGWISAGNATSGVVSFSVESGFTLTSKAAATYTPGTTDQYVSSYRWLTGSQTIKGDANLVASNIADGVSIFGVTGTFGLTVSSFGTSASMASGTTVIAIGATSYFTVPAGQWQINVAVRWNANSAGRRYALVSTTATATTSPYEDTAAPVNGGVTLCNINFASSSTASQKFYVRGFQNGVANLVTQVRAYWIGIPS